MFTIQLAGIKIAIENKHNFVKEVCRNYIIESLDYDFAVSANNESIEGEKSKYREIHSEGFIESVCLYREIANLLPKYDAYVLHSAAIVADGFAHCFAAKSGVGKTTHILNWLKVYRNKVYVINGDKPVIRFINEKPYVFGTPWSGKEDLNRNTSAPLKSICFLKRSDKNSVSVIDKQTALKLCLHQIYLPLNSEASVKTLDLLGKTLDNAKLYNLLCNKDSEAAIIAYNALCKEDINESN